MIYVETSSGGSFLSGIYHPFFVSYANEIAHKKKFKSRVFDLSKLLQQNKPWCTIILFVVVSAVISVLLLVKQNTHESDLFSSSL